MLKLPFLRFVPDQGDFLVSPAWKHQPEAFPVMDRCGGIHSQGREINLNSREFWVGENAIVAIFTKRDRIFFGSEANLSATAESAVRAYNQKRDPSFPDMFGRYHGFKPVRTNTSY